jgi:hypothetical protein
MPNFYSTNEFESRYTYTGTDLGAVWTAEKTAFRVWAPTAKAVSLCLYKSGTPGTEDLIEKIDMVSDVNGTWIATKEGNLNGVYYTYLVTLDGQGVEACDPYARTTGVNGERAMVIDLASTNPDGWTEDRDPNAGKSITDAVIYELHVRDLSADESSGIVNKGKYMGVVETTYTKGKKALGIPRSTPFFNDGVVLVNVDYCRENNLISKVIEQVNAFGGNPPVLSEGVLNKICGQNVKYLSLRYNLISGNLYFGLYDYDYLFEQLHYEKEDLIDSCENPVIVHYIAGFYNRPWCKKCTHPFKEFYLYYKSISPWKDSPLQDKDLSFKIKVAGLAYKVFGCRFIDKIRDILGLLD